MTGTTTGMRDRISRAGALGAIANVRTRQGDVTTVWVEGKPACFATQIAQLAGVSPARLIEQLRDGGPVGQAFLPGIDHVIVFGPALQQLQHFVSAAEQATGRRLIERASTSAVPLLLETGIHLALTLAGTPRALEVRRAFFEAVLPEWHAVDGLREAAKPALSDSQYVDLMVRGFELLDAAGYTFSDEEQQGLASCLRELQQTQVARVGDPPDDAFEATDVVKHLGYDLQPAPAKELDIALSAGLRLLGFLPERSERLVDGAMVKVNRWPSAAWDIAVPIVDDFCTLHSVARLRAAADPSQPSLN